jgi:predicted phosphodiesterase
MREPSVPNAPVRIGVIGDVHACDRSLGRLLEHLVDRERVDAVCCVGDLVNGPGDPDRCAALLRDAGVMTVRGNHDRWLIEGVRLFEDAYRREDLDPATVADLCALPASVELVTADGTRILLCHGLGGNDMNQITADDYGYALEVNDDLQALLRTGGPDLVVKGHRHRHAVWRIGAVTFVDAGALVVPQAPCAVVIDIDSRTITPLRVDPLDGVAVLGAHPIRN